MNGKSWIRKRIMEIATEGAMVDLEMRMRKGVLKIEHEAEVTNAMSRGHRKPSHKPWS